MASGCACPQLPPHTPSSLCHSPGLWVSLGKHKGQLLLCKMQVEKEKLTKLEHWEPAVRMDAEAGRGSSAPHQVASCPSPSPTLGSARHRLLWLQSPPASDPTQDASLLRDACTSSTSEPRRMSRHVVVLMSVFIAGLTIDSGPPT